MQTTGKIPDLMIGFVLVTVLSLLIGLSQRKVHAVDRTDDRTFGTDRTFTFIGIYGFVLYILSPTNLAVFLAGGVVLSGFLMIYYYFHLKNDRDYGITTILIGLLTYCLGPLAMLQPKWMVLVLVVTILVLVEMKDLFITFTQKISKDEYLTLAKFLVIAGIILPLVPDTEVYPGFSLTPYKVWLAVVVVSSLSYASYLLRKFVMKKNSIVVSGILGGLYSSTATTVILARRSKEEPQLVNQYAAATLLATAMMYLRILVLILIFNMSLFLQVWTWFLVLFLATIGTSLVILFHRNKDVSGIDNSLGSSPNPLEFKTALVFTALFVLLSIVTQLTVNRYGTMGLNLLSFVVGLVDIDPFLISLFEGKFGIGAQVVAVATFQAIISNNVVKLMYGMFFGTRKGYRYLLPGFLFIILLNLILILFI